LGEYGPARVTSLSPLVVYSAHQDGGGEGGREGEQGQAHVHMQQNSRAHARNYTCHICKHVHHYTCHICKHAHHYTCHTCTHARTQLHAQMQAHTPLHMPHMQARTQLNVPHMQARTPLYMPHMHARTHATTCTHATACTHASTHTTKGRGHAGGGGGSRLVVYIPFPRGPAAPAGRR